MSDDHIIFYIFPDFYIPHKNSSFWSIERLELRLSVNLEIRDRDISPLKDIHYTVFRKSKSFSCYPTTDSKFECIRFLISSKTNIFESSSWFIPSDYLRKAEISSSGRKSRMTIYVWNAFISSSMEVDDDISIFRDVEKRIPPSSFETFTVRRACDPIPVLRISRMRMKIHITGLYAHNLTSDRPRIRHRNNRE